MAIFSQTGGQFDGLSAGHRYQLYGDPLLEKLNVSDASSFSQSRRLQLQPVVSVTSEASHHTARTTTGPAPGSS